MRPQRGEAMTHSTLEDHRSHFTGRPWHFSISPSGNIMSAGNYRVVEGKLEKVDTNTVVEPSERSRPAEE